MSVDSKKLVLRIALGLLALLVVLVGAWTYPACAADKVYTPAKGSAERAAIMDGLRTGIPALSGKEVVFVVRHLKAAGGWAFAIVMPQSPDARVVYEDISALLQKSGDKWQVVHIPVFDPDAPELSDAEFNRRIMKRFPKAPAAIFD